MPEHCMCVCCLQVFVFLCMCLIQFLVRESEGDVKQKYFRIFQLNRKNGERRGRGGGRLGQKMCHKKVPLLPLVQFWGCLIQKIWCSLGVWNKMPFLVAQNRILGSWVPEKQTDFLLLWKNINGSNDLFNIGVTAVLWHHILSQTYFLCWILKVSRKKM